MMRQTLLILLITYVLAKGGGSRGGRSRGGRSSGFGDGGSPKPPTVRGSIHNSQSGYRRHHYIYYYAIIANSHTHRNGYLYSNDPAQIDGKAPFDCGNGKIIRENQVCDWIDDCGNGVDERVPLPCKGKPSQQELNLYFIITTIYFIWIFILSYLLYGENSHDKHHEEDHGYDVQIIFPSLLFFINIIFLIVVYVNDTSIIIEYYITTCVFTAIGLLFALCIPNNINRLLWFTLFITTIVTIFHGSIYFSYIPTKILDEKEYSFLNIPVNTSINASIYNIQKREGFWISEYANTSTFTIQFNKTIQLAMIQFFPTYPNKTTDKFKLKGQTGDKSWTTLINGPMPNVSVKSAFEIVISDDGLPIDRLQFIATPISSCNETIQLCYPGLDELRVFGIKN